SARGQAVEQMIAFDAARRAVPRAVFVKRDDNGGAAKLFCHLRRDQTNNAAMPAYACDDGDRAAIAAQFIISECALGQLLLYQLALTVARIEMLCEATRFRWLICLE